MVAQQGKHDGQPLAAETYLQGRAGAALGQPPRWGSGVEYNSRENDFLQGEGFGSTRVPLPRQRRQGDVVRRRADRQQPSHRSSRGAPGRLGPLLCQRQRPHGRFVALRRQQPLRPLSPSGSIGWALSDEAWLSAIKTVGDLKLRLSYGEMGNQGIADDYAPLARFRSRQLLGRSGHRTVVVGQP
ncbi:MAG: hypothetical protein IPK33_11600 [Gemmatimonadetes bacterium]|nr:hypothetical protein [Gemmatimonadota bacterium]